MNTTRKKISTFSSRAMHCKHSASNIDGYITLISVLVIGAVGIAIATSLILLGLSSSRTSFAIEQSNQAKALVNACAEYSLQQIKNSPSYTGTSGLRAPGLGTCSYLVQSQGGQNRTILSIGTVGAVVRKLKIVIVSVSPNITISTWQEVALF